MKILLLSLFLLSSCGDVSESKPEGDGLSTVQRFEPLVPDDVDRLQKICDALSFKSDRLGTLINMPFTFSYAQKGCDQQDAGATQEVNVTIQRPNSSYVFKQTDGELFPFPDVETHDNGVMKDICANLGSITNPLQTSPQTAMWFSTYTSPRHCTSDANHLCILIQKGRLISGVEYLIHTNEWIKFNVAEGRTGFFTERSLRSLGVCAKGKSIAKNAKLI
ncbi:MAG TPA: hypothetical protein VNJ01_02150 [Bacteriovoracaceae bacterium]|nr:hypothetical protein [Bacteriovoracaceae bacterium]